MGAKELRKPKEIEINGSKFVISKIPAIQAQQIYREIMQETGDDGDIAMTYLASEATLPLLSYAASADGEEWVMLDSEERINFCCSDLLMLINLEAAMIRYNFGFLFDGSLQKVLGVLRDSQPDT